MCILNKLKKCYLKIATFFNKITPKFIRDYMTLWSPLFLLLCLQPMANWLQDKTQITDIAFPLISSLVSSTLLALIFYRASTKNRFLAFIFAIGAQYAVIDRVDIKKQLVWNFSKSNKLFSWITDSLGLTINLIILILLASGLLYYLFFITEKFVKARKWNLNILFRAAVIAVVVAFAIQTSTIVHIAVIKWPQFFYRPAPLTEQEINKNPGSKPDIYYIVPDRYTNQSVLKNQLNFDNSDFISFLQNNGFSIDPNAYGSYPNTITSISSTLTANYHSPISQKFGSANEQTNKPYYESIQYSPIIEDLKKIGYSYYNLGTFYDLDNQSPLADHNYSLEHQLSVFDHTFTLNNFPNKEFTRSIYGDIARWNLKIGNFTIFSYKDSTEPDFVRYKLAKLREIADESSGPKFIYAHFLVPHDPFYFNADGSLSDHPLIDNVGKPVKEKYVGQVEFINSQMKELISLIKQKTDNEAVIIIQADEGTYASHFSDQPSDSLVVEKAGGDNEKLQALKLKYGVLAAYYIPEAKREDIKSGGDNVNIFRLVFNTYFGTHLPYLPKCNYVYVPGNIFKYSNVTDELTGLKNPQCPEDGIF